MRHCKMDSGGKSSVSFKERKGFFIPRWILVAGLGIAALCILLVGLIVGYLAPCGRVSAISETGDLILPRKELPYVLLPRSIVPEHYNVELRPYIWPGNFTFDGNVLIQIRVLEATNNISLHINNITIKENTVRLTGFDAPAIQSLSQDKEREFFILHLNDYLTAGQTYEVQMDYIGNLNDQLAGFYRSSYEDSNKQTK